MAKLKTEDITPLSQLRVNAGFSREKAAHILNIVMMTLYRYEHGINDIPLGIAENMASLYKVPFNDIREAAKATKEQQGVNSQGRINR